MYCSINCSLHTNSSFSAFECVSHTATSFIEKTRVVIQNLLFCRVAFYIYLYMLPGHVSVITGVFVRGDTNIRTGTRTRLFSVLQIGSSPGQQSPFRDLLQYCRRRIASFQNIWPTEFFQMYFEPHLQLETLPSR